MHVYLHFVYSNSCFQDDVIPGQIKQVEQYIIQFNDKQTPIIKKIRKLIKTQENGLNSSKSSDDDNPIRTDDEKPVSEEEILESLGLKHVARTPDGKIDHAKLSMKDRMAIVRGDIYAHNPFCFIVNLSKSLSNVFRTFLFGFNAFKLALKSG